MNQNKEIREGEEVVSTEFTITEKNISSIKCQRYKNTTYKKRNLKSKMWGNIITLSNQGINQYCPKLLYEV